MIYGRNNSESNVLAAYFENTTSGNEGGVVKIVSATASGGYGLEVDNNSLGRAVYIHDDNSSNSQPALYVTKAGTGYAASFECTGLSVTGAVLSLFQNTVVSTNFKRMINIGRVIWLSDGTNPNGNLTGTQGDVCLNGPSGQMFYSGGGTTWTGM
jgi:hypothetical protein